MTVVRLGVNNPRRDLNVWHIDSLKNRRYSISYVTWNTQEGFIVRPCGHKILVTKGKNYHKIFSRICKYFMDNPCKRCR